MRAGIAGADRRDPCRTARPVMRSDVQSGGARKHEPGRRAVRLRGPVMQPMAHIGGRNGGAILWRD